MRKSRIYYILWAVVSSTVLVIVWTNVVHELLHYLTCRLQGFSATLNINYIQSRVECNLVNISLFGATAYTLSPYFLDLLVIILLSSVENRYLRLVSYAAFFDVLLNLVLGSFFGRFNDHVSLKNMLSPFYFSWLITADILVFFLAALSILFFVKWYYRDFINSKNKDFFTASFICFLLFVIAEVLCWVMQP